MRDIQSHHEENPLVKSTGTIDIDLELLPKERGKTVKYISAAVCFITAAYVMWIGMTYRQDVFVLYPSLGIEAQRNITDFIVCYIKEKDVTFSCLFTVALVFLGVEFGALVDPLSRLVEERHHRHERYEGRWKKLIIACFSGIVWSRILALILITATAITVIIVTERRSFEPSHLAYICSGVCMGPLITQVLDLNTESKVYLSTLLEKNGMNTANVLGWSYYHTYLKPAVKMFAEQTQLGRHAELSLNKLLLLIPVDYPTTADLRQIDNDIALSLSEHSNTYSLHYSVYQLSIVEERRKKHFAIQYVQQPLKTLRSMTSFQGVQTTNVKIFDGEVKLLYRTLTQIIAKDEDINETCLLVPIKTENISNLQNGWLVKRIMAAVYRSPTLEKTTTCKNCERKTQDRKRSTYGATASRPVNTKLVIK